MDNWRAAVGRWLVCDACAIPPLATSFAADLTVASLAAPRAWRPRSLCGWRGPPACAPSRSRSRPVAASGTATTARPATDGGGRFGSRLLSPLRPRRAVPALGAGGAERRRLVRALTAGGCAPRPVGGPRRPQPRPGGLAVRPGRGVAQARAPYPSGWGASPRRGPPEATAARESGRWWRRDGCRTGRLRPAWDDGRPPEGGTASAKRRRGAAPAGVPWSGNGGVA